MEAVELLGATDHLVKLLGLKVPSLSELDRRHRNFLALRTQAYAVRLELEHLGCDDAVAALSSALELAAVEAGRPTRNPRDRKNVYKAAEGVLAPAVTAAARAASTAVAARKVADAEEARRVAARREAERQRIELETRIRLLQDELRALEVRMGVQSPTIGAFVAARLDLLDGLGGLDPAAAMKTVAQVRSSMKAERKALRKAEKGLAKTAAYALWKRARQQLATTEALPADDVSRLRQAVDEAARPLFATMAAEPSAGLVAAAAAIEDAVAAAEDLARALAERLEAARGALGELGTRLAADDRRTAFELLDRAEASCGLPHPDAEGDLDAVDAEVVRLRGLATSGPDEWAATMARRVAFREGCREVTIPGLFLDRPGPALAADLDAIEAALTNGAMSYALAEPALADLERELVSARSRRDTFVALADVRAEAVARVEQAADAAQAALEALEGRVGARAPAFRDEQGRIASTWAATVASGSSRQTLDAGPTVAAYGALARAAAATTGEQVVELGHLAACEACIAAIDAHRSTVLDLAEVAETGERDVSAQRAESGDLMDRVAASGTLPASERRDVLARIEVESADLVERLRTEAAHGRFLVEGWQRMVAEEAAAVDAVLRRIETVVSERSLFAADKTSYATYAAALRKRLEPLAACGAVAMPVVLDDTMRKLVALHTDAKRALEGADGIGPDGELPLLEQLRADLRRTATSVASDSSTKTWAPTDHARIGEELRLLLADVGAEPVAEVRASLARLEREAGLAASTARARREHAERVREAAATARKKLKANKAVFKGFPRVYDDLDGTLKGARDLALREDLQDVAEGQVRGAVQQLTAFLNTGGGLASRDAELAARDATDADTASRWEARLATFQLEFTAPLAAVSSKGAAEVRKLVAAAKKAFDNGDAPGASDQLDVAERRAVFLRTFPAGQEVATARRLLDVEARFRESVRAYAAALDEVEAAVTSFASDVGDGSLVAPVTATIDELKVLFGAQRLTAPIRLVADRGAALSVRAAARETALAIVRQYQSRLEASEALRMLKGNPFGVAFTAQFQLGKVLLDLERCLRIAVDQSKVGGDV